MYLKNWVVELIYIKIELIRVEHMIGIFRGCVWQYRVFFIRMNALLLTY